MNRFTSLLFVCLFLVFAVDAQTNSAVKRKTDKDETELIGSVHVVKIERELLESVAGKEFGSGWLPSLTTYNRAGDIVRFVAYDDQGNLDHESVSRFDSFGNKIQETYSGADGRLLYTLLRTYDEDGNEVEFKNINADGTISIWIKFSYDKQRNKISHSYLNGDGQVMPVNEFSYDENGRMREESSRSRDEQLIRRSVYSYEDKNKKEELKVFDAQGVLDGHYVSLTDEKGDRIELSYDKSGKIIDKQVYEYQRDEHGNWITETASEWEDKDGALILNRKKLAKRTITYY